MPDSLLCVFVTDLFLGRPHRFSSPTRSSQRIVLRFLWCLPLLFGVNWVGKVEEGVVCTNRREDYRILLRKRKIRKELFLSVQHLSQSSDLVFGVPTEDDTDTVSDQRFGILPRDCRSTAAKEESLVSNDIQTAPLPIFSYIFHDIFIISKNFDIKNLLTVHFLICYFFSSTGFTKTDVMRRLRFTDLE